MLCQVAWWKEVQTETSMTSFCNFEPGDLLWVDLQALARQKLSPKWKGSLKV